MRRNSLRERVARAVFKPYEGHHPGGELILAGVLVAPAIPEHAPNLAARFPGEEVGQFRGTSAPASPSACSWRTWDTAAAIANGSITMSTQRNLNIKAGA